MSDKCFVEGRSRETAVLLLAAAESLGLPASVVETTSKGYLVPPEVAETADEAPVVEALTAAEVPAESALKGEWVDYAVGQGADREEAEALTKAQLIEQYGNKE